MHACRSTLEDPTLRQLHGGRAAWLFAVVAAAGAIGLGLLVNLLPLPAAPAAAIEHEAPTLLEQLSLVALALLYAASLLRRGARAFLGELLDTGAPAPAHSH